MDEQNILDLASLLLDASRIQDATGDFEKATESRELAELIVNGLDYPNHGDHKP